MIDRFKTLGLILNVKALLIAALAVLSTWLCLEFDLKGDFPLTLIATAVPPWNAPKFTLALWISPLLSPLALLSHSTVMVSPIM